MSDFLINLARRSVGLAPVLRARPGRGPDPISASGLAGGPGEPTGVVAGGSAPAAASEAPDSGPMPGRAIPAPGALMAPAPAPVAVASQPAVQRLATGLIGPPPMPAPASLPALPGPSSERGGTARGGPGVPAPLVSSPPLPEPGRVPTAPHLSTPAPAPLAFVPGRAAAPGYGPEAHARPAPTTAPGGDDPAPPPAAATVELRRDVTVVHHRGETDIGQTIDARADRAVEIPAPVLRPLVAPGRPVAPPLPDPPPERIVTVRIGAIEIHPAEPSLPAASPQPPAATPAAAAPPTGGFDDFVGLRSYLPWSW